MIQRKFRWLALFGSLAVLAGGLSVSACTVPPRLLAVLFENVPPPGQELPPEPVVRQPRRPPYQPPKPPPIVEMKEEAPKTDWAALLAQLPKDPGGGTNWVQALTEKLIEPKPGLDPKAEDEPVLDLDVELIPKSAPDFKATYPHKVHTQILTCANCHPAIFQMEKGADPITMEKIFAGEFCGRCHGKVAFDPVAGCPRCHLAMPK
jgi:c(7)-type cytochrome triheme protein